MMCTNCANACRRCDEGRPCQRCVKFQMEETCVDTERKERKKGIKHRPIKRREKLPATKNTPATEHREKLPATKNTPATEHIPDPAAPDPAWVPCTPLGFMCCPPPGFIPNAPPLPHGLQYFLPPYAHPFPYPGFFYPPFPAPFPIEQPMMTEGDHTE
ncbi:hypothetical protein C0989_011042 [Termitomyces sp. Mn162]|nr:hypothetical protein C0989_011042 [Termitomyces sp. Mn162]